MRIETKQIKIYKFEELGEDAKQNATNTLMSEYFWADDAIDCLKECLNAIGVKLHRYDIDWSDSVPTAPPKLEVIRGLDLEELERLANEMLELKFSGFCLESSFGDEVLNSLACNVTDQKELAMAGFAGLIADAQRDYQAQFEEDYMQDHCDANEYEFTEDGELY